MDLNKKGLSTGFAWIYGLVSLFGLGILFIVFNMVLAGYVVPIIKTQMNATIGTNMAIADDVKADIVNGIDRYMIYFNALPFILFFIVVIYMIVSAVRKEREGEY